MANLQLLSLAKKQTVLTSRVPGPAVDTYTLGPNVVGLPMGFECLLWDSAPAESLTEQYPAVPSQSYDWSAAPSWARWAAFDENGTGNWFIDRPILDEYNGRWRASVTEKRSWPMYANVALTRGWKASLGYRPGLPEEAVATTDCSCPTASDTVITDVTGYIAVTMGEAVLLPDCCNVGNQTEPSTTDRGAILLLQQSADGLDWASFGRAVLSSINTPVYFEYTPTESRIRAVVSSIWGNDTYATVTVSAAQNN